jgi:hypothetical protein
VSGGVQLRIAAELPIDPAAAAEIPILEHRRLYDELALDPLQRQAVEDAVRAVLAGQYARSYGGRRAAS